MRYKGEPVNARAKAAVTIPRQGTDPLTFEVAALPMGVRRMYETICPRPDAPFYVKADKISGEQKVYKYDDPDFVKKFNEWREMEKYFYIFKALELDTNVEFSVKPTDAATLAKFADELRDAGLSDGDCNILFKKITEVSNFTASDIQAARASF